MYGAIKCKGTQGELLHNIATGPCPVIMEIGVLLTDINKRNICIFQMEKVNSTIAGAHRGKHNGIEAVTSEEFNYVDTDQGNTSPITEEDGPPPGFEKPIYCVRRSPRISSRPQGDYMGPEERARLVTKPDSLSNARKPYKKKTTPSPVKLDYLQSFDPLSESQAEAVFAAAGIKPGTKADLVLGHGF